VPRGAVARRQQLVGLQVVVAVPRPVHLRQHLEQRLCRGPPERAVPGEPAGRAAAATVQAVQDGRAAVVKHEAELGRRARDVAQRGHRGVAQPAVRVDLGEYLAGAEGRAAAAAHGAAVSAGGSAAGRGRGRALRGGAGHGRARAGARPRFGPPPTAPPLTASRNAGIAWSGKAFTTNSWPARLARRTVVRPSSREYTASWARPAPVGPAAPRAAASPPPYHVLQSG
jgi:hypothetical protein